MKKLSLLSIITLMTLMASHPVLAHGRFDHFSFGINSGYPGFYGGYGFYDPFFYPPFYGAPPVVVPMAPPVIVPPPPPPVYIQQQETPATVQPQTHDWYYCASPEGYYPYVKQCPGGWMRVAPRPSNQ